MKNRFNRTLAVGAIVFGSLLGSTAMANAATAAPMQPVSISAVGLVQTAGHVSCRQTWIPPKKAAWICAIQGFMDPRGNRDGACYRTKGPVVCS